MAIKFLNTVDTDVAFVSKGGSYSVTNETKTDVAISVLQNNKIYSETSSGYLRNLMYHDSNGSIQIGQDGTALITDITMKPGTSGNVIFRTQNNSETVRISSTGNVGIGTTSPAYPLDVNGDIRATAAVRANTNLIVNGYTDITGRINHRDNIRVLNKAASNWLDWAVRDTTGAEAVIDLQNIGSILAAGNVGIGTTVPTTALQVNGAVTTTTGDYVEGSTGSRLILETASSGNTHSYIQAQSSGGTSSAEDLALQLYGGNVGIGTDSPTAKLHVEGDIELQSGFSIGSNDGNYWQRIRTVDNTPTTTNAFNFETRNGSGAYLTHMVIRNDGNVGIGTTSPVEKLEVSGSVRVGNMKFEPTNAGRIGFNRNTSNGVIYNSSYAAHQINGASASSNFLEIQSYSTGGVYEGSVVVKQGNLGIGTNSPSEKLDVSGKVLANAFRTDVNTSDYSIISRSSAGNAPLYVQSADSGTNQSIAKFFYGNVTPNQGTIVLNVAKDSTYFSNTNVGIGTTNPSYPLVVNGEIEASGDGYLINGMGWANEGSGVLTLGDWDGHDFSTRIMDNYSNEVLRVTDGKVGIGVTSPGSKLDIVGATNTSNSSLLRVRTTGNPNAPEKVVGFYVNTNTERGFISVNQYATAYSTSSDYRLKENIIPIHNSIERLKELKPSRFNFIGTDPTNTVDGFIAHEAAEVVPESVTGEKDAVDEDNNPAYQGIDQGKIVPLLTAALQEAINKIEQLEKRIQTLENN